MPSSRSSPPPDHARAEPTPRLRADLGDVAREAGVSLATVDRALHGRPGVHARTVERVQAAVQRLGFRPDPAAARLARTHSARNTRIVFLLPEGSNSFVGLLDEQLAALHGWLAEQRTSAAVEHVDVFSPQCLATRLAALRGRCEAVVVMGQDHPRVRAAIDELVASGVLVLTLVSDVPQSKRTQFVGIDNVAAGRTAASLLGRFVASHGAAAAPAKVGIVLGSAALRDHAERLLGFQQVMQAEYPQLQLLTPVEGEDSSERTRLLAARLLKRERELAAIYSIGAGNRGIEAALKASGRAGEVVWICHELTPHARRALLEGTASAVINQDAGHEVRSACRRVLAALNREPVVSDQERIRIDIFLRDNLP